MFGSAFISSNNALGETRLRSPGDGKRAERTAPNQRARLARDHDEGATMIEPTSDVTMLRAAVVGMVLYYGDALGERPLFGAARRRAPLFLGDGEIERAFLAACEVCVPDMVEEYGDVDTVEEVLFDKDHDCVADVYEACFAALSAERRAQALALIATDVERSAEDAALMRALEPFDRLPRPAELAMALREAAVTG